LRDRVRHNVWLAGLWRRLMWRTTVIAVTGSVGKTTCRELLYRILADQAPTHVTLNNENDEHGLPPNLWRLRPWHRFAVIEVAASGPGTLGPLARAVRPDIAIVTAVKRTHTNRYRDIDEIAQEKAELVRALRRSGTAVLNGADLRVAAMGNECKGRVATFGESGEHDVRGSQIDARWPSRLRLVVETKEESVRIETQLVGTHWVNSVLASVATAHLCGVSLADSARSIAAMPPFRGRMQPIALPNGAVAINDANASLDVLDAMLEVARQAGAIRKVLVLDDLNDTDSNHTRKRRELAGELVSPIFDLVLFYGPSAHRARASAIRHGMRPDSVATAERLTDADAWLRQQLRRGDLVFVKGRNLHHLNRLPLMQMHPVACTLDTCQIRKDCEVCPALYAPVEGA
jgi:UDP-N-acetylmuramoyl-tripeptide--D-alanyl-D-alanine ligase